MENLTFFLYYAFVLINYHESFAEITFEDCGNPKALFMTPELIQEFSRLYYSKHLESYGPVTEGYPTYRDIRGLCFNLDWKSLYSPVAADIQSPKGKWTYKQILEIAKDRAVFKVNPNFLPNPEHLMLLSNEYEPVIQQLLELKFALVYVDHSENRKFIILQSCDGRNTWVLVNERNYEDVQKSYEGLSAGLSSVLNVLPTVNDDFDEKKDVKVEYQYGAQPNEASTSQEFEEKNVKIEHQ